MWRSPLKSKNYVFSKSGSILRTISKFRYSIDLSVSLSEGGMVNTKSKWDARDNVFSAWAKDDSSYFVGDNFEKLPRRFVMQTFCNFVSFSLERDSCIQLQMSSKSALKLLKSFTFLDEICLRTAVSS